MNCVPKHSQNHADSEYVSYTDHKGAKFIGNKQTDRPSTLYTGTDTNCM